VSDEKKNLSGKPLNDSVPSETPKILQQDLGLDRRAARPAAPPPVQSPSVALGDEEDPKTTPFIPSLATLRQATRQTAELDRAKLTTQPDPVPASSPFAKTVLSPTNPVLAKIQAAEKAAHERAVAERANADRVAAELRASVRSIAERTGGQPPPTRPPVPTQAASTATVLTRAPQAPRPPQPPTQPGAQPLSTGPAAPTAQLLRQSLGSRPIAPGELMTDPMVRLPKAEAPSTATVLTRAPQPSGDATSLIRPAELTAQLPVNSPIALSGIAIPPPPPVGRTPARSRPNEPVARAAPTGSPAAPPAFTSGAPTVRVQVPPPPVAPTAASTAPTIRNPAAAPPGVPMPASAERTLIARVPPAPIPEVHFAPAAPLNKAFSIGLESAEPEAVEAPRPQFDFAPDFADAADLDSAPEVAAAPDFDPAPQPQFAGSQLEAPPPEPTPLPRSPTRSELSTTPGMARPASISFEDLPHPVEPPMLQRLDLVTQPGVSERPPLDLDLGIADVNDVVEPSASEQAPLPDAEESEESDQVFATVASLWRRIFASILDATVVCAVVVGLLFVALTLLGHKPAPPQLTGIEALIFQLRPLAIPAGGLTVALGFGYTMLFASALKGRTFGRLLFGIRLVDASGKTPGFLRAFFRAVFALLSFALFLTGFWLGLFDRRGQTLHDKLTRTFVIRPV
jgi:uncharacterized RDD family membrane protein YckC